MVFYICVAIVSVLVLAFGISNILYKKTNAYSNSILDIRQFVKGNSEKLDLVYTGSTYSKFAFGAAEELNLNWGDFTLQAQSLEMDNAILHKYIDKVRFGGVVVVVAAACLLLYEETRKNPIYTLILDKDENPIYTFASWLRARVPLLFEPKKAIKILFDDPLLDDIYETFPTNMSSDDGEKELLHLVNLWKTLFGLDNLKDASISKKNEQVMDINVCYLDNMISGCLERGRVPVIVVPPFSKKMNQYFSKEFEELVITHNIDRAVKSRQVFVLNYQEDGFFQNRPELYVDGGFRLNRYGSKIFIQRLISDLKCFGIAGINTKRGETE